ncbi:MAG: hypothetical protein J6P87_03085 [Lachnospiraceae bacterium]|nr:hypothetical protein [Lachnospiraceae bacterium]
MNEIITVLRDYMGPKALFVLYAAALVFLAVRERDRLKRALFVYLPLFILIVFMLPPVRSLYVKIEEAATYYRLLWMIPVSITTGYAAVSLLKRHLAAGTAVVCALICVLGSCVYTGPFVAPADNRLHLPQAVVDVSDYLLSQSEGSRNVTIAVPGELIHFIRQYDTGLRLAFGREVYVAGWSEPNPVYEEMELKEKTDCRVLAAACREYRCNFIVLNAAKPVTGDLREEGYELLALLDGYYIYKDPQMPFQYDAPVSGE